MTEDPDINNPTALQIRLSYYKSECEAALKEADRQTRVAVELSCKIMEIEEMLKKVR